MACQRLATCVATAATVIALSFAGSAQAQGQPQAPEPGDPPPVEPVEGTTPTETPGSRVGPGVGPQANLRVVGDARGTGFKLTEDGRSRVHLGLDAGLGFDVNPYSVPFQTMFSLDGFSGDVLGRVRPRASIVYPGSLLAADADAVLDYAFYPGVTDLISPTGSSTRALFITRSLIGAGFEVNRGGMFSFAMRDDFSFNNDPAFLTPGATFTSVNNRLRAGLGFRPGGGTLKFRFDGYFGFQKYFDIPGAFPAAEQVTTIVFGQSSGIDVSDLDNLSAGIALRGDWRFLPKTGAFVELNAGTHLFPFQPILQTGSPPLQFPVTLQGGLMGQFTSKLSGLASVGYTNPISIQNSQTGIGLDSLLFIGLIAQLEARWQATRSTYLAGGFVRRVQPAPLYQHITNNRLYVMFTQTLLDSLVFRVNTGVSLLMFGRDLTPQGNANDPLLIIGQSSRFDGHFDLNADVSYFLFDWLSFGVSNNLDLRLSNASSTDSGTGAVTNFSFVRNETMVMASLHY